MMIPLLILAAIDLAEVRSTAVDFLLDRQENKVEKEVVQEFESENRKINSNISKLEEQVRNRLI